MTRMLFVVTATFALVFSGIPPARAEIKPFYNPANRASPTGFTTGYKDYRTIGCPGRELLGKPCPFPAATTASAKSVPVQVGIPSRSMENTPAAPELAAVPTAVVVLAQDSPLILGDVNFDFDSESVLPLAESILNLAAEDLKSARYPHTLVEGYTDSTGTFSYNVGLSERRARSVKDYLVGKGVPADTLTTRGYGETQFAATNTSMDGRHMNRRVELHISE